MFGRSRLSDQPSVAERGDETAVCVAPRAKLSSSVNDAVREIDTLRSINAHLVREIAQLKQREAQAQRLADRDGLTGLYNRRRMTELLEACVADAAAKNEQLGLLFIDLDGFKGVNDRLGHAAGDKLLMSVSSRLASRVRTGDFVCRYGGDEFVVILPRVPDVVSTLKVAHTIRRRIGLPFRIDGAEVNVTAAIGVAMYPDEAKTAATLLHMADESMYRAKALSSDLLLTSAPARRMDDKAKRRLVW